MSAQCWHRYVTDLDGVAYCERCGDCPAEREAEYERGSWKQAARDLNGGIQK